MNHWLEIWRKSVHQLWNEGVHFVENPIASDALFNIRMAAKWL